MTRFLIAILLSLTYQSSVAQQTDEHAQDTARIASVIEAIGVFVDFGEFEAICQLYEDVSTSDYSSLWGNKPSSGSPSNRATGWSGFVPGFDLTRHEIDVARIDIDGNAATAVANVSADHWLSGERWSISGVYDVSLKKRDGQWRIVDWVFTLDSEFGDRKLVDKAEELAEAMLERPIRCP